MGNKCPSTSGHHRFEGLVQNHSLSRVRLISVQGRSRGSQGEIVLLKGSNLTQEDAAILLRELN